MLTATFVIALGMTKYYGYHARVNFQTKFKILQIYCLISSTQCKSAPCWIWALFVLDNPVSVDGCRTRYCIQMMWTGGDSRHPRCATIALTSVATATQNYTIARVFTAQLSNHNKSLYKSKVDVLSKAQTFLDQESYLADGSTVAVTALKRLSWPARISSTSSAFNSVMFVTKRLWSNPTRKKDRFPRWSTGLHAVNT